MVPTSRLYFFFVAAIVFLALASHFPVGSLSKSSVSLVLVSLLMREWREDHYLIVHSTVFSFRYDIFAINIGAQMLGYVYTTSHLFSTNQDLGVKVATPIGNLVGQLLFDW